MQLLLIIDINFDGEIARRALELKTTYRQTPIVNRQMRSESRPTRVRCVVNVGKRACCAQKSTQNCSEFTQRRYFNAPTGRLCPVSECESV
jgi:hypothetical protein